MSDDNGLKKIVGPGGITLYAREINVAKDDDGDGIIQDDERGTRIEIVSQAEVQRIEEQGNCVDPEEHHHEQQQARLVQEFAAVTVNGNGELVARSAVDNAPPRNLLMSDDEPGILSGAALGAAIASFAEAEAEEKQAAPIPTMPPPPAPVEGGDAGNMFADDIIAARDKQRMMSSRFTKSALAFSESGVPGFLMTMALGDNGPAKAMSPPPPPPPGPAPAPAPAPPPPSPRKKS